MIHQGNVNHRREMEKLARGNVAYLQSLTDEELLLALSLCKAKEWVMGLEAGVKEFKKRATAKKWKLL